MVTCEWWLCEWQLGTSDQSDVSRKEEKSDGREMKDRTHWAGTNLFLIATLVGISVNRKVYPSERRQMVDKKVQVSNCNCATYSSRIGNTRWTFLQEIGFLLILLVNWPKITSGALEAGSQWRWLRLFALLAAFLLLSPNATRRRKIWLRITMHKLLDPMHYNCNVLSSTKASLFASVPKKPLLIRIVMCHPRKIILLSEAPKMDIRQFQDELPSRLCIWLSSHIRGGEKIISKAEHN